MSRASTLADLSAGTGTLTLAFLSCQHAGPPADFVFTRNALHQLPDSWKAIALDRVAGMLRPGGVLRVEDLIYDFQPSEAAGFEIAEVSYRASAYGSYVCVRR
jgi:trans-aconitate methyltransferase